LAITVVATSGEAKRSAPSTRSGRSRAWRYHPDIAPIRRARAASWIVVACAAASGCIVAVSSGNVATPSKPPSIAPIAHATSSPEPEPDAEPAAAHAIVAPPPPEIEVADPADDPSIVRAEAYGALDDASCYALLKKRGIAFTKVEAARGVETPIRLTGKMHGVDFHGGEPAAERATSPTEIVDCRLALALYDFSAILEQQGVVESVHWSIYRAPPAGADPKKAVDHPAALAMDLGAFIEIDGSRTGIAEDWHGEIGGQTCGKGLTLSPSTKRSWRLRAILCFTAKAKIFNLILTPNFNAAHHDHFHLEIKRNSKFSFVQ
jgi:hypothetical protein